MGDELKSDSTLEYSALPPGVIFDVGELRRYKHLLVVRRYASLFILPCWLSGYLARDSSLAILLFPLGVASIIVTIITEIRLRPFQKRVRKAKRGLSKWAGITFDPVEKYEDDLMDRH
jgi:hypothetical protein